MTSTGRPVERVPASQAHRRRGGAVICCYTADRWDALLAAVRSVQQQAVPVDLVVVVDHNLDLLDRLQAALPEVRVMASTAAPGLSGARNTGVEVTEAEVVLFLDDDASADPHWAGALLACFDDAAVMAAGGAVEPAWAGGRAPAWFPMEFGWVVGCSYTGQPTGRVRNPIGASMAVRRAVFEQVGGFSAALGRVGTLPVGCEETELCLRIDRRLPGSQVLLEPAARVRHLVPEQRQRIGYAVRRCFHEGRSKAAVARLSGAGSGASPRPAGAEPPGAALATEADYVRRVLPRALGRHLRAAATGSGPDAVAALTLLTGLGAAVLGFALEYAAGLARGRTAATPVAPRLSRPVRP